MYSVVLMAAMTQAVEIPDLGRRGHGCNGGGCYGGGCYGGWGGGCRGGGCWGGGGYGGCYGGGYGGCCGGGGWVYGGGWGRGYAYGPATYSYGGSYARYSPYQMMPYQTMPYTSSMPYEYRSGYYAPGTFDQGMTTGPAPATVVVHLPADARLTVDDQPTRATSDERVFISPPLQPGQNYFYVLRAELNRNGEKLTASQNVTVRAGQTSEVTLEFPRTGSNQERDRDLDRNRTPDRDRNRDQDRDRR